MAFILWCLLIIILLVGITAIILVFVYKNNRNIITGGAPKSALGIKNIDKYMYGNGGSSSIIILTNDKRIFKVFPHFNYIYDKNLPNIPYYNKEVQICKLISKNVKTDHIIKYINDYDYDNAKELYSLCPKKFTKFLGDPPKDMDTECYRYYMEFANKKLDNKIKVMELEYCPYSSGDLISFIAKQTTKNMKFLLDIFIFQMIHTVLSIKEVYPYFTHGDLFLRNILGYTETEEHSYSHKAQLLANIVGEGKNNFNKKWQYYTYEYKDIKYLIPRVIFFPKINDFGFTNLNDKLKYNDVLYESDYKDVYNLILDIYNGGNLGAQSLTKLVRKNKLPFLKSYFSTYFNVDVIDKYISNNKNQMDWDWYTVLDKDFLKSIEMKKPEKLIKTYFRDLFGYP